MFRSVPSSSRPRSSLMLQSCSPGGSPRGNASQVESAAAPKTPLANERRAFLLDIVMWCYKRIETPRERRSASGNEFLLAAGNGEAERRTDALMTEQTQRFVADARADGLSLSPQAGERTRNAVAAAQKRAIGPAGITGVFGVIANQIPRRLDLAGMARIGVSRHEE